MSAKKPPNFSQHKNVKFLYLNHKSGIYYFVKDINGVRYKKSLREKDFLLAKKKASEMEKDIFKRISGGDYNSDRRKARGVTDPLLKDLWGDFIEFKKDRVGPRTMEIYKNTARHIFAYWGKKTLSDFKQSEVERWEAWFIRNKGELVYFNTRKSIVTFKNWLTKKNLIRDNIDFERLDKTVLNRINKREVHGKTYTQAEIKLLLASKCSVCALPVAMAITTGARKSEILNLKKEQIYKNEDGILVIKYWSFKNKKFREVPVPSEIKKRLNTQIKDAWGNEWLFPGLRDKTKPVTSQLVDRYFMTLKNEIGLKERKTFHDLRRTFATMTAENGWPPVVACRILDMSLEIYDKVYTKPSQHSLKKFIDSVDISKYSKKSHEIIGSDS